jgi:hypothetical protein
MSFESLYARSLDATIARQLADPGPPPESDDFHTWHALQAGAKGVPAGALEVGASGVGILGTAATESARRPRPAVLGDQPDDAERRARDAQWVSQAGPIMRNEAATYAPPETANKADQVLFGLTRLGTKVAGAVTAAGPFGGAALVAAEETNTSYERLKDQGVDPATALKAAGVEGVAAGAGVVLPVGGSTAARTALLTLVSGPATYAAQETLARKILEAYPQQAAQHDPTDGLGLALSIAIPGAIGGLHLRGVQKRAAAVEGGGVSLDQMTSAERAGLKYDDVQLDAYAVKAAQREGIPPEVLLAVKNAGEKSAPNATSRAGAQGVMQFMPGTWREIGHGDPLDPLNSIDAGARYLKKLHDAYGDWDAAVAHYNGGGAQAAIVRGGGRPTIPETAAYLDRVIASQRQRLPSDARRAAAPERSQGTNALPHPAALEAAPKAPAEAAAPSLDSQRVAMLMTDSPDLQVKLPGSDTTMSAAEALAQAKELAAHESKEADLYQAALDCALGG